nr:cellulase family glycosylhydrolase [uncultured Duganella sp.]
MKFKMIAAILLVAANFAQSAIAGPLSISNGKFIKDGKPFYGIGMNYFNAFYRYGVFNDRSALTSGLATLKQYNVPFIRVPAIVFWPNEIKGSYIDKQAQFLDRLTEFMDAAEAQGVGVVLSVFFNWSALPDLQGEHLPAIGNPNSQARAFMRNTLTQLVNRYKDHNALWAWEFANEATSVMDIPPSVGNHRYLPKAPTQGAPERTVADNITPADIISALTEFATVVRSLDPNTPIFSGNDVPYYCAYNLQHGGGWNSDTPAQFGATLVRDNPAPIDTLSMHLYPKAEGAAGGRFFAPLNGDSTATFNDIVTVAMAQSVLSQKPFFLGEFGVDTVKYEDAPQRFETMINSLVSNRVQMSALWVFDYSSQNDSHNITATNSRKYMLEKVRDVNLDMATWQ